MEFISPFSLCSYLLLFMYSYNWYLVECVLYSIEDYAVAPIIFIMSLFDITPKKYPYCALRSNANAVLGLLWTREFKDFNINLVSKTN